MTEQNPSGDKVYNKTPRSLDTDDGSKDEDWSLDGATSDLGGVQMGRRWVAQMIVWKRE